MANLISEQDLIDKIREYDRADYIMMTTETPVKMTTTGNPFYKKEGRASIPLNVVTKVTTAPYGFGGEYVARVNQRQREEGIHNPEYQASAPRADYKTVVPGKVLERVDAKTGDMVTYLVYYPGEYIRGLENITPHTTYYVDGVEATPEQMDIIKKFTPSYGDGIAKQNAAGISKGNEVNYRLTKFNNIVAISFGSSEHLFSTSQMFEIDH